MTGRADPQPSPVGAGDHARMPYEFGLNEPLQLNRLRRYLRHWGIAILDGRICRNPAWPQRLIRAGGSRNSPLPLVRARIAAISKYTKSFTLYVGGDEVYERDKADALEAELKPLSASKKAVWRFFDRHGPPPAGRARQVGFLPDQFEQPFLVLLEWRPALALIGFGLKAAGLPPALHPADRRGIPDYKLPRCRSRRRATCTRFLSSTNFLAGSAPIARDVALL